VKQVRSRRRPPGRKSYSESRRRNRAQFSPKIPLRKLYTLQSRWTFTHYGRKFAFSGSMKWRQRKSMTVWRSMQSAANCSPLVIREKYREFRRFRGQLASGLGCKCLRVCGLTCEGVTFQSGKEQGRNRELLGAMKVDSGNQEGAEPRSLLSPTQRNFSY